MGRQTVRRHVPADRTVFGGGCVTDGVRVTKVSWLGHGAGCEACLVAHLTGLTAAGARLLPEQQTAKPLAYIAGGSLAG